MSRPIKRRPREDEATELEIFDWLSPRLDDSILYKNDIQSRLIIAQIEHLRHNKTIDTILCRCFIGGSVGRQLEEFYTAASRAQIHYRKRGYNLEIKCYCNDYIKNIEKWTPATLVDEILKADFHLFITHLHEGNIAKNGSWNVPNILSNLGRLRYHLGNIMGDMNMCPIFRQGKREVYEQLPEYCLPTLFVDLPSESWEDAQPISLKDIEKVER